jgi:hypothetical protein
MLIRLFIIPLIFILFGNVAYSQVPITIKGSVIDTSKAKIAGAKVQLFFTKDSIKTISDTNGNFKVSDLKHTAFDLKVQLLGYTTYQAHYEIKTTEMEFNLPPVILKFDIKQLKEVIIRAKVQAVLFKKDTTEYNVDSYSVKNGTVEDLLRQLPGIEVDKNGNVTSEGKAVTKLKVNGQDFFTNNVQNYIKQLPADIMNKLQIVNDFGDDAAFSGIKTGPSSKTLNLVTKPGMNNGVFGNLNLYGGTNKRLGSSLNTNYWRENKQISAAGDFNTTNNVGGTNNNSRITLSYNDKIGKFLKVGTLYNYIGNRNSAQNNSFITSVTQQGNIDNTLNNTTISNTLVNSFSGNIKYQPSSKTYFKADINLSRNSSADVSNSSSVQTGIIRQELQTQNDRISSGSEGTLSMTLIRKLQKPGRLFSLSLDATSKANTDKQQINNYIRYTNPLNSSIEDSTSNRLLNAYDKLGTFQLGVTYSEPLVSGQNLDVNYTSSGSWQRNTLSTETNGREGILTPIDSLSNTYNNSIITNQLSFTHRIEGKKFSANEGINFQHSLLSGVYESRTSRIRNSVFNFAPVFNINYFPSASKNFDFHYIGTTVQPSIDQLQPVQNTRDIQYVVVGNPDLKPSFAHKTEITFRYNSAKTAQTVMLGASGNLTQNEIVTNTQLLIDTLNFLKQITSYRNTNGSYSFGLNYNWSMPLSWLQKKVRISLGGNALIGRKALFTNDQKSYNLSRQISQSFKASGTFSKVSADASVVYMQSNNQYTAGEGLNTELQSWTFALNENFNFFKNNTLTIEGSKTLNKGYLNIDANSPLIVNATITQQLMKGNLSFRIQALDIFNQSSKITQSVVGNSVVNNRANYISRYIIVGLSYRLSKFGTVAKK